MIDALTLDQIRTFVAIADSGSFRSAAKKLSRVQSGVSVAIANLESTLGTTLFDRSGHRPVLTAQGQVLLSNARDILLRVDVFRARAREFGRNVETQLDIVVDTLYPLGQVAKAMTQMRNDFPSVALRLWVEPLGGPLAALRNKRCAIAVMVGEDFRDPRITFHALNTITQVAVAAVSHPLVLKSTLGRLDALDLADHLQIVLSDSSDLSAGRDFGVASPQTCRVNTQDAKHALILAGMGWGRLPEWLVERDLVEGRLARLPANAMGREGAVTSNAYVAHRLDETLGPAAQHLARLLSSA